MTDEYREVLKPIEEMVEKLNARAVFGEPSQQGNVTIIPVASVTYGFGYGSGSGSLPGAESDEGKATSDEPRPAGSGGGGGGGGRAKPLGYLHVTEDEVRYVPIEDESRLAIPGMLMVAWSTFWVAKAIQALARRA